MRKSHAAFLGEGRAVTLEPYPTTQFTAADIMMHFPFGTMKAFYDVGLDNRPHVKAWLARISDRPGYQRAMKAALHERDPALDWGVTRSAF